MQSAPEQVIAIQVETSYVAEQSQPANNRYVFAYTVTITNKGHEAARLLSRHWIITDANNKVQEVKGEGVVGEQPYLQPGESYRYSSAAMLETPVGCMQGSYRMVSDSGTTFDAPIEVFNLSMPNSLH